MLATHGDVELAKWAAEAAWPLPPGGRRRSLHHSPLVEPPTSGAELSLTALGERYCAADKLVRVEEEKEMWEWAMAARGASDCWESRYCLWSGTFGDGWESERLWLRRENPSSI